MTKPVSVVVSCLMLSCLLLCPARLFAHCDGMDGPVVQAARRALESGNVALVLIWVQEKDSEEIRRVFAETLAVRKLSPEARELADRHFFETLVRLHRAGEGAPFTGLKPAGRDLGPAIPAADRALESGSAEALRKLVVAAVDAGLSEQFQKALARKNFSPNDVAAGREYVRAYVEFVHYIERLYEAARLPAHGHFEEEGALHSQVGPGDAASQKLSIRGDKRMDIKRVTPEEAKQLLESNAGYVYLDVRTVAEFDAGHVPGAKNIPVAQPDGFGRMQLNPRFVQIVQANFGHESKIITGCKVGGRSMRAAAMLLEAGFSNVLDMRGGFDGERDDHGQLAFPGWAPRGFPTTTESAAGDRYESLLNKAK